MVDIYDCSLEKRSFTWLLMIDLSLPDCWCMNCFVVINSPVFLIRLPCILPEIDETVLLCLLRDLENDFTRSFLSISGFFTVVPSIGWIAFMRSISWSIFTLFLSEIIFGEASWKAWLLTSSATLFNFDVFLFLVVLLPRFRSDPLSTRFLN